MTFSLFVDVFVSRRAATRESAAMRRLLTGITQVFLAAFLFVPLLSIFVEALRGGGDAYWAALKEPDAVAAIELTLLVAAIAVPLNLVFGLAAASSVSKFEFRGKSLLITLI